MSDNTILFEEYKTSFPWKGNDIYLEQNDGQVKAVCSNSLIAKFIASVMNDAFDVQNHIQTASISTDVVISNPEQSINKEEIVQKKDEELIQKNKERQQLYKNLVQTSYYLYVAMSKAKIPKNSIETMFLEKAYHKFYYALFELLEKENIHFESEHKKEH